MKRNALIQKSSIVPVSSFAICKFYQVEFLPY